MLYRTQTPKSSRKSFSNSEPLSSLAPPPHHPGMHRKSMEAAETLKNDDSGGSDREDTASKASDSSMHSPHSHSRSFSSSNGTAAGEQNNNKISMGNHNSGGSPTALAKEQHQHHHHKSPSFRSMSPGSVTDGAEKSTGHHHSHMSGLSGKQSSVLSPPPPGLTHHHAHHHHLHPNHHLHNTHPLHLMHPGMSPTSNTRTTPPNMPLSLTTTTTASNGGVVPPPALVNTSPSHLLAHHPNGLEASKGMVVATHATGAFHPESDPEAFRWVHNSYGREPISMIR